MSAFRNIVARRRPSLMRLETPEDARALSDLASIGDEPPSPKPLVLFDPIDTMSPPFHERPATHPAPAEEPPQWGLRPPTRIMGDAVLPDLAPSEEIADAAQGAPADPSEDPTPVDPESKIWDLEPAVDAPDDPAARDATAADAGITDLTDRVVRATAADGPADAAHDLAPSAQHGTLAAPPSPTQGRRARTRLLGFHAEDLMPDPFASGQKADAAGAIRCPIGFLAIVDGPGLGTSFALAAGLSTLGRGEDQTVTLDFGDDSISRNNHASIAYDEEENQVLIGHGGKSNLVRLNGKPLVSTTELAQGDQIRIGRTTLRYVALCGPEFSWSEIRKEAGGDV